MERISVRHVIRSSFIKNVTYQDQHLIEEWDGVITEAWWVKGRHTCWHFNGSSTLWASCSNENSKIWFELFLIWNIGSFDPVDFIMYRFFIVLHGLLKFISNRYAVMELPFDVLMGRVTHKWWNIVSQFVFLRRLMKSNKYRLNYSTVFFVVG